MINLHQPSTNGNQQDISFVGIVGKAGPRQTTYGLAIDVADNRTRPCRWFDVIANDAALVPTLSCGDIVEICAVVLQSGRRPLIRGSVKMLRR